MFGQTKFVRRPNLRKKKEILNNVAAFDRIKRLGLFLNNFIVDVLPSFWTLTVVIENILYMCKG